MPTYEINIGGEPDEEGDNAGIVEKGDAPATDGNQPNGQLPDVMPGLQEVPLDDKEEKPEVNIGEVEDLLKKIKKEEAEEDDRNNIIDDILHRN